MSAQQWLFLRGAGDRELAPVLAIATLCSRSGDSAWQLLDSCATAIQGQGPAAIAAAADSSSRSAKSAQQSLDLRGTAARTPGSAEGAVVATSSSRPGQLELEAQTPPLAGVGRKAEEGDSQGLVPAEDGGLRKRGGLAQIKRGVEHPSESESESGLCSLSAVSSLRTQFGSEREEKGKQGAEPPSTATSREVAGALFVPGISLSSVRTLPVKAAGGSTLEASSCAGTAGLNLVGHLSAHVEEGQVVLRNKGEDGSSK